MFVYFQSFIAFPPVSISGVCNGGIKYKDFRIFNGFAVSSKFLFLVLDHGIRCKKGTMNLIIVICHRKVTCFAALNVIMISFLATKCESLATGRTVQDMRNPRIATDKCGRQGVVSSVCDPDDVVPFGKGMLLNCIFLLVNLYCGVVTCLAAG